MKRYSIQIKDGQIFVSEALPADTSLRVEFCLGDDSEDAFDVTVDSAVDERELETTVQLPRIARGTPSPEVSDTEVAPAPEQLGTIGDEDDFEDHPTFDLSRSAVENLAKRGLPLPPPASPADLHGASDAPRTGNLLASVSGTTTAATALPDPYRLDVAYEEGQHADQVRPALTDHRKRYDLGLPDLRSLAPVSTSSAPHTSNPGSSARAADARRELEYPRLCPAKPPRAEGRVRQSQFITMASATVVLVATILAVVLR